VAAIILWNKHGMALGNSMDITISCCSACDSFCNRF